MIYDYLSISSQNQGCLAENLALNLVISATSDGSYLEKNRYLINRAFFLFSFLKKPRCHVKSTTENTKRLTHTPVVYCSLNQQLLPLFDVIELFLFCFVLIC